MIQGLYAVTPDVDSSELLLAKLEKAFRAGVGLLQYRRKRLSPVEQLIEAGQISAMAHQFGATFIVNDNLALANAVGANGLHWGREDVDIDRLEVAISDAKNGRDDFIVGISCYSDFARAVVANTKHADYLAFGSIFASNTKPDAEFASLDLIRRAKTAFAIPVVAIGGITRDNVADVIDAGADAAAVITDLFDCPIDGIAKRVAHFQSFLSK